MSPARQSRRAPQGTRCPSRGPRNSHWVSTQPLLARGWDTLRESGPFASRRISRLPTTVTDSVGGVGHADTQTCPSCWWRSGWSRSSSGRATAASPAATPSPTSTPTVAPTPTVTPVPTPPSTVPPVPAGTWRGIVSEPKGPAADGRWTATVTLLPCDVGEPCGTMDWVGLNAAGGEISTGCALTFVGMWNTKYHFQESATLYMRGEWPPTYGGVGKFAAVPRADGGRHPRAPGGAPQPSTRVPGAGRRRLTAQVAAWARAGYPGRYPAVGKATPVGSEHATPVPRAGSDPSTLLGGACTTADSDPSAGAFERLSKPAHDFVVDVVGVVDLQVVHPVFR